MANRTGSAVSRQLRTLFNLGAIGEMTDGQLLERFATRSGESAELAFAALLERHGPMVLRVCRSALRDAHQVDDAFQATFLILVQKARSLWVNDSLGPWLHRVAHRVATRARHAEARRQEHERRAAAMSPIFVTAPVDREEVAALVHAEIDRLPERFRIPVVICDLQGQTHEKAARHLGWPVGTVKSRLARAREILRGRLARRGLGPSRGLIIAGNGSIAASRASELVLPPSLIEATTRAASALSTGNATIGAISAGVITLIEQGLKTMVSKKLKLVSVALFLVGTAGATAVAVLAQSANRPMPPLEAQLRPSAPIVGGRTSDSTSADGTVPDYITESRVMMVTRLEEELAEARARLDRLRKIGRASDDAVARRMRGTVDALEHVLARIDVVLVDADRAYPTMFDFSRGRGPEVFASTNQPHTESIPKLSSPDTDPFADQSLEAQLIRARDRLQWADEMCKRGYVPRSVVELERQNVLRVIALQRNSQAEPEPEQQAPSREEFQRKPADKQGQQQNSNNDNTRQPSQNNNSPATQRRSVGENGASRENPNSQQTGNQPDGERSSSSKDRETPGQSTTQQDSNQKAGSQSDSRTPNARQEPQGENRSGNQSRSSKPNREN